MTRVRYTIYARGLIEHLPGYDVGVLSRAIRDAFLRCPGIDAVYVEVDRSKPWPSLAPMIKTDKLTNDETEMLAGYLARIARDLETKDWTDQ